MIGISNKQIKKIIPDIEDFKAILQLSNQAMTATISILNDLIEQNQDQFSEDFPETDPYLVILKDPEIVEENNELNNQIKQYISDLYRMPNTYKVHSLLESFMNRYPDLRSNHIHTTDKQANLEHVDHTSYVELSGNNSEDIETES